jgi:pSer/pThr/pTyr-binding forkhead associated (FHA) protein
MAMSPQITLSLTQGFADSVEFIFHDSARCVVGRATDCDIQLPLEYGHADVSRHHCVFEIDPPRIRVRDLGSLNGTHVNGMKIGHGSDMPHDSYGLPTFEEHELWDGDEVRVGQTILHVGIAVPEEERELVFFPAGLMLP